MRFLRFSLLPVAFVLALLSGTLPATGTEPSRGHLVIFGGGTRPVAALDRLVELAGDRDSQFVVISAASSEPLEAGRVQANELRQHGARTVDIVTLGPEDDLEAVIATLEQATALFLTGGDQSRLHRSLSGEHGSRVLAGLHGLLQRGGIVAGSSAGAAVMGDLMITGNELEVPERDSGFRQIKPQTIEYTPGFSFWPGVIVDQHFVRRRRHNRLLSLVLDHKELVGVGIDEATAVIVGPSRELEVLGEGTVTVYDARKATVSEPNVEGLVSGRGLSLHVLRSGDRFDPWP